MKGLTKEQRERLDAIVASLEDKFNKLTAAVDEYNDALSTMWGEVERAQRDYNEAVSDAIDFRDEIVGEVETYMGERSEKWQEGERAESYENFKSEWEGVDLSESEMSAQDDLDVDVNNAGDGLGNLPTEIES